MNIYRFFADYGISRRYLRGNSTRFERKPDSNYQRANTNYRDVKLKQGSFVSNILWDWGHFHVTEALKEALQKDGFEANAFEFEPTEIVEDKRPSKDRKKLPLDQIPQFYHAKLITSIPLHQDYTVPVRGSLNPPPLILDGTHHPGTDFFRVPRLGLVQCCTERGKAFLESYPKTYCNFSRCELRD